MTLSLLVSFHDYYPHQEVLQSVLYVGSFVRVFM